MKARLVAPTDIPTYQAWRGSWGWSYIPEDRLPKNGIIVEDEDSTPLLAGFLYRTDAKVVFLAGLAANPDISELKRGKALKLFSEAVTGGAKAMGAEELIGWTGNSAVLKASLSQGADLVASNVGLWRKEL